jgi:cytochrome P450
MRLFPPAWMMTRRAERDAVIGGHPIEAGSLVSVSPYVIHRRDDLWPNPEGFEPERWLAPKPLEPFSYIPFGGGPRKCIGDGFAMTEGIMLLAAICRRYSLHLSSGYPVELDPLITLRPKHGLWMRVYPRLPAARSAPSPTLSELRAAPQSRADRNTPRFD